MAVQAHPNYNEKITKILAGLLCSSLVSLLLSFGILEMGAIEKANGVVHKAKAYQKAVQALKVNSIVLSK